MAGTPELSIRLQRVAFNKALLEGDLAAIGPILAPTAILVTGSDSAVISGRKAQLAVWKREFASPDRAIYTRSTEAISPSAVEPIAFEHGQWQSVGRDGQRSAHGSYTAKWRAIGGTWMIEAELYLTLG